MSASKHDVLAAVETSPPAVGSQSVESFALPVLKSRCCQLMSHPDDGPVNDAVRSDPRERGDGGEVECSVADQWQPGHLRQQLCTILLLETRSPVRAPITQSSGSNDRSKLYQEPSL